MLSENMIKLVEDKKAQVGTGLTWAVATPIIIVLIFIFFLFVFLLSPKIQSNNIIVYDKLNENTEIANLILENDNIMQDLVSLALPSSTGEKLRTSVEDFFTDLDPACYIFSASIQEPYAPSIEVNKGFQVIDPRGERYVQQRKADLLKDAASIKIQVGDKQVDVSIYVGNGGLEC